eukprot:PLAT140.4.p1 GENE.PLAT140.4~~PLAT140.4.p1  ORF type:complete len:570 (+),score=231.50 PLAT140.4:274-1983(+)
MGDAEVAPAPAPAAPAAVPAPAVLSPLAAALSASFAAGDMCDVQLRCGEETLAAHRVVLASRCPFFQIAMDGLPPHVTGGDASDDALAEVVVEGLEAATLRKVVHFIYTGQVAAEDASVVSALEAAGEVLFFDDLCAACRRDGGRPGLLRDRSNAVGRAMLARLEDGAFSDLQVVAAGDEEAKAAAAEDGGGSGAGESTAVHRLVLASSSDALAAAVMEAQGGVLQLHGCNDVTLTALLRFLYSDGSCEGPQGTAALPVLALAARYGITAAVKAAVAAVQRSLTDVQLLATLPAARELSADLHDALFQTAIGKLEALRSLDEWEALPEVEKAALLEAHAKYCDEAMGSFMGAVTPAARAEVTSSIRAEVQSFLRERLNNLALPPQEGLAGSVEYRVSGMAVSGVEFEEVDVVLEGRSLVVTVDPLSAAMKSVKWAFKKTTFPRLSDEGMLDAQLRGVRIVIRMELVAVAGTPQLRLAGIDLELSEVACAVDGAAASWLYNLLISLFSTRIKASVQEGLTAFLGDAVRDMISTINMLGGSLVAGGAGGAAGGAVGGGGGGGGGAAAIGFY